MPTDGGELGQSKRDRQSSTMSACPEFFPLSTFLSDSCGLRFPIISFVTAHEHDDTSISVSFLGVDPPHIDGDECGPLYL